MRLLGVLLAALGIGCAVPAAATTRAPHGAFEKLRTQDLRVATVAYRLAIANKKLCRDTLTPQPGLILHSLEQYGPADRAEAARSFGLGPHITVMAVVEGSPAAMAGLVADDQLVSVNGRDLSVGAAPLQAPTRASVDRAEHIIVEELKKGPIVLRVSNARNDRDVRFRADVGCPTNVELVPGDDVNAWADGDRVVVSTGMLKRSRTDDDLALVIAHELAHNLLHHRQRLGSARSLFLASEAVAAMMRETEEEADRLAVMLVAAAGYDLGGAESFLSGLMGLTPSALLASTHPTLDRRLALLRAEIAAAGG